MSTITSPSIPESPHRNGVDADLPHTNCNEVELARWQSTKRFYYRELIRLLRNHIPEGARVLQVGCGMGDLLAGVEPGYGLGIEHNESVVQGARERYPDLTFTLGQPESFELDSAPFDFVIIGDAISQMHDVQACLERVRKYCKPSTRVLICNVQGCWEPVLRMLGALRLRRKTTNQNWLSTTDVMNLLRLADFEVVAQNPEMILPVYVPGLTELCNRFFAHVWPTQHLSLMHVLVARPTSPPKGTDDLTCSVIIPTLNEKGNIEAAVRRTPKMGKHTELIFVEGGSTDGTEQEILRVMKAYSERDIKLVYQGTERGKGVAVRKGFAEASGDVLMILDSDLTVVPEDLPKFFNCIVQGKGEFVNGTRLVYPMEKQAMRTLNKIGNWFFSVLFSWLLRQRFRDTLCGTKVLLKSQYEVIAKNRSYFGKFDPFGDFDLIFGASKANLKIIEIPVRYRARTYGDTEIQRFRHGLLLLKMSLLAFWKLRLR